MTKQTKLDGLLYDAVMDADIPNIRALMQEEANPLGVIALEGNCKDQAYRRMLAEGDVAVINTVLEVALNKYKQTGQNILDFSRIIIDGLDPEHYKINLLQFACFGYCSSAKSLIRYALDTKQDVKSLLNATILSPTTGEIEVHSIPLAELIISRIAVSSFDAAVYPLDSKKDFEFTKFMRKWRRLDGSKPLPTFSWPLEIVYHSPWRTLEYLIDNGLEMDCPSLPELITSSQDAQEWEEFKGCLIFGGVMPTSIARESADGRVCFDAELDNERGHKIPAIITLDFSDLDNMMDRKFQERAANKEVAALSAQHKQLATEQTAIKQQVTNTASEVEEIPSVRLNRFKKRKDISDEIKECVDILYDKIATYFDAHKLRTTGLFVNNRTTNEARCALLLSGAFSRVADASGVPFIPLFAGFVGGSVEYITSQYAKKQSAGVGKAIMKQDIETLSLDIALAIAAALQGLYGPKPNVEATEKVALAVTKEIDNLHNYPDVRGQSAVFQYLLAVALNTTLKLNPALTLSQKGSDSSKSPVMIFSSADSHSGSSTSSNGSTPFSKSYHPSKQSPHVPNLSSSKGLEKMVALKDEVRKPKDTKERKKGFRCVIS